MAAANIASADPTFSLEGGPGSAFMKRARLVHPALGESSARTAIILVTMTWLPLHPMSPGGARLW